MRIARYFLALSLLSNTVALASDEEATPDAWMQKGRSTWGLAANVGRSQGSSSPERNLASVAISLDRVLTNAVGPGILHGRMGVTVEFLPLFLLSGTSTTYGAGFNLLGRHYLDTHGSVNLFITIGAGMTVSEDAIPTGSAKVNFTPQAGLGLRWSTSSAHIWTIEYRFHHLSNGGRVQPNPGINSSVIQVGYSFSRALAE